MTMLDLFMIERSFSSVNFVKRIIFQVEHSSVHEIKKVFITKMAKNVFQKHYYKGCLLFNNQVTF